MSNYPEYERLTIGEVMPPGQNFRMIFYFLQQLSTNNGVPWKPKGLQVSLDTDYVLGWSGKKYIAPLVENLLGSDTTLNTQAYTTLANIIWMRYWRRWWQMWNLYYDTEYDPIENYNMTENMTDDQTVTEYGKIHTRDNDLMHTVVDRTTNHTSSTVTDRPKTMTANALYGFNSVATPMSSGTDTNIQRLQGLKDEVDGGAVPADLTATDGESRTTNEQNDSTGGNSAASDTGTITDLDDGQDTQTRNYELTRRGNIGVTTTQDMMEKDWDWWRKVYFRDIVYPDLDEVLTLRIY